MSREVYKWKARLNVHGGKQEHGVNYWETYAPVVTWASLRLVLILSLIYKWHTRQIDFVLAYPQADVECDIYMEVPEGFQTGNESPDELKYDGKRNKRKSPFVLKLLKNVYGQKQAGRVWNKHLHKGLIQLGFQQSAIDECVYYRGNLIYLCYVDDSIATAPTKEEVNEFLDELKQKFDMTDEGDLNDFIGVNITRHEDGKIELSQPHLIEQILRDLNFQHDTKKVNTPGKPDHVLRKNEGAPPHKADWHYRSIIGKLNFVEKSSRPDIANPVHQCARFSADPREPHTDAVRRICRYLAGTKNRGIIMDPNDQEFEVFVDADFCGLWDKDTAIHDPSTTKSRTGFIIKYAGCPIIWASRLQTETALSTTLGTKVHHFGDIRAILDPIW